MSTDSTPVTLKVLIDRYDKEPKENEKGKVCSLKFADVRCVEMQYGRSVLEQPIIHMCG